MRSDVLERTSSVRSIARRFALDTGQMLVHINRDQLTRFEYDVEVRFPRDAKPPSALELSVDASGWGIERIDISALIEARLERLTRETLEEGEPWRSETTRNRDRTTEESPARKIEEDEPEIDHEEIERRARNLRCATTTQWKCAGGLGSLRSRYETKMSAEFNLAGEARPTAVHVRASSGYGKSAVAGAPRR